MNKKKNKIKNAVEIRAGKLKTPEKIFCPKYNKHLSPKEYSSCRKCGDVPLCLLGVTDCLEF